MNTFDFFDDSNIPDASYGYPESQPPPLSQPNGASLMPLISLDLNSASQMECDLPVAEVDDHVLPATVIRSSPPTQPPPLSPMTPSQTSSARQNNSPPSSQPNLQSTERSASGSDIFSQSQSSQPIIRNAPSISLAALLNPVFPIPEAIRSADKPAPSDRVYALPTQLVIESQVFDDIPPPFQYNTKVPSVPLSSNAAPILSPAPQSLPARPEPVCNMSISPPVHLIRLILAAEHSPAAISELVQLIRTNSAFEQLSQCPEWSMLIAAQASHVVPSNALVEADTEEEDQSASQSRLGVLQHDFSPSPPSSPEFTAVKSPLVSVLQSRSLSVSQPFISSPAHVAAPTVASSDVVGSAAPVFVPDSQASSNLSSRHSSASRDSVPSAPASESIADDASSETRPSTTKKKRKRSDRTKQVTLDAFMTSRTSAVIDMANSADDDQAAELSAALLISSRTAPSTSSSTLFPEPAGIAHATMIAPSNLYSQAQSQYEYEDPFRLSLPKKSPAAATPSTATLSTPSAMPLSTRLMRTSTAARFRSALADAPKSPPPSARVAPRKPITPLLPDSQPAEDVVDVISTKVPAMRTLPSFARPSVRLNPPPVSVPASVPEPESQVF